MTPEVKALKKIVHHNTTLIRRARKARRTRSFKQISQLQDRWKESVEKFRQGIY